MAMQIVKRGSRPSKVKVTISPTIKIISFSAGICRKFGLKQDKHKFALIGFDTVNKDIGISFLNTRDKDGNAMKLTWTPKATSFSFPIRSLLTSFSLDVQEISGTYSESAITGPVEIGGFDKEAYLLHTTKRSRG